MKVAAAVLLLLLGAGAFVPSAAAEDAEDMPAGLPEMEGPFCPPPPDSRDGFRVLYCGAVHGVPKALDQYYDNMTAGPIRVSEVLYQTWLLTYRARGCLAGDYPPCPKMDAVLVLE